MFSKELDEALKVYENIFDDSFPTIPLAVSNSDDKVISIINDCVRKKKDVYEAGYLTLDDGIKY